MSKSSHRTPAFVKKWQRLPRFVYRLAAWLVRLLRRTCPLEVRDPAGMLEQRRPWPVVFVLWHNRLFFLPDCFPRWFREQSVTLASVSRDGEHAARFIKEFGFHEVVRGSTSRGGARALLELRKRLKAGYSVVLTVDGPRGPRYEVQQGAAVLAALTGVPVVPIGFNAPHRWELSGWDRTQIPKPFHRMELVIGPPLPIGKDAVRDPQAACRRVREALLAITWDVRGVSWPRGIRWSFAPGTGEAVREFLIGGDWRFHADFVKGNRRRKVFRLPADEAAARPPLILKVDRPPEFFHRIVRWFRSKADAERLALQGLRERGVPAVEPVAWGHYGAISFLVTRELAGIRTSGEVWQEVRERAARRAPFLAGLAEFAGLLREKGVLHPDLHPGNVLVAVEAADDNVGERYRFVLLDPVGLRLLDRRLSIEESLLWCLRVLESVSAAERRHFLCRAGVAESAADVRKVMGRLRRAGARAAARRWPGRRRRLLGESSLCTLRREDGGRWLLFGGFPPEHAQAAVAAHRTVFATGGADGAGEGDSGVFAEMVKDDRKRRLSRVRIGERSVIVKEYTGIRFCCRAGGDRRAWLIHYRCAMLGIAAPQQYAWLRAADGTGFLIVEDVGRLHLKQALRDVSGEERRRLLAAAGRFIGRLHGCGCAPRDLKSANFIVRPDAVRGGVSLVLVDLDDVRFPRRLNDGRRRAALAGFLESLPETVKPRDMLYFLAAYRLETGIARKPFRRLADGVLPSGGAGASPREQESAAGGSQGSR